MFTGIDSARVSKGGIYFKPGVYLAKVLACKGFQNRQQIGTFVIECELLESSEPSLPPGTLVSQVIMLNKEPALGNIKAFIAAAMKDDAKNVTEEMADLVASPGNPLKGIVLRVSASNIKTKAGAPFTKLTWLQPEDAAGLAKAQEAK
jgi:hypothetical protein